MALNNKASIDQIIYLSQFIDLPIKVIQKTHMDWNYAQNYVIQLGNPNLEESDKKKLISGLNNFFKGGKKKHSNYNLGNLTDDQLNNELKILKQKLVTKPESFKIQMQIIRIFQKLKKNIDVIKYCQQFLNEKNYSIIGGILARTIVKYPPKEGYNELLNDKIENNIVKYPWIFVKIKINFSIGNFQENIELIENNSIIKNIDSDLHKTKFLLELSINYLHIGNFEKVIELTSIIINKIDDVEAFGLRSHAYEKMDKIDLAIIDLDSAFNIVPKVQFRCNMSALLDKDGKPEIAIRILNELLDPRQYNKLEWRNTSKIDVIKVKAFIYRKNGNFKESLECYDEILEANEHDSNGYCGYAMIYELQKKFAQALEKLDLCIKYNDYSEFVTNFKIRILLQQKNYDLAQKTLNELIEKQNIFKSSNENFEEIEDYKNTVLTSDQYSNLMDMVETKNTKENTLTQLTKLSIKEILKKDESKFLEFKSSIKYDYELEGQNKQLVEPILKTICAFLNTEGGILIIGYNDNDDKILGLSEDYKLIDRDTPNWDNWVLFLQRRISDKIGANNKIEIKKETIEKNNEKKDIAKIIVQKSKQIIFLPNDTNKDVVYCRENANNRELDHKELLEWSKENDFS